MAATLFLDHLAHVAPELSQAADVVAKNWAPEPVPATTLAAELARALASNSLRLPPQTLRAVFDLCEEAITQGSDEERAAFATGFLEALQHADARGEFDFGAVAGLLGPASKTHCTGMDQFYGSHTRGL